MPIEFQKKKIRFAGHIGVEEADELLAALQKKSGAAIDLSDCEHIHPANLQVLLAAKVRIAAWPKNQKLHLALATILNTNE
jgi:hypothetical protein